MEELYDEICKVLTWCEHPCESRPPLDSAQCAFDSLTLSDEQLVSGLKKRGYSGKLIKTLKV